MLTFILSVVVNVATVSAQPAQSCEWVGPRLDGIGVQICDGSVKAYRDQAGNVIVTSEVR